jgi:hypothetical protein
VEAKEKKDIRKRDTVVLPDGTFGEALEVFTTDHSKVYKIRRFDNEEVQYFDDSKVELRKRHVKNLFASWFLKNR